MSGEVVLAAGAGVTAAGMALVFDQNLAMASAGGLTFYLAISVAIPLQTRFWFSIGSFILGYLAGLVFMSSPSLGSYAPLLAFGVSAIGSSVFASLYKWSEGGPMPGWLRTITRFLPFTVKKGSNNE